jgi:Uncharacterized protein conserved in bacteria
MKLLEDIYVYEPADLYNLSYAEKSLLKDVKLAGLDTYMNLCKDFGVRPLYNVEFGLYEGDVYNGRVNLVSLGTTFTYVNYSGNLAACEIFINLPHLLTMPDTAIDETLPHEVAHLFADQIYKRHCNHEKEWQEVMNYLHLPVSATYDMPYNILEKMIAKMKFHLVKGE